MKKTVDIVIPTFKPDEKFHNLMQMLFKQTYQIGRILVMNTDASLFPKEGYDKLPNVEIGTFPGKNLTMAALEIGPPVFWTEILFCL